MIRISRMEGDDETAREWEQHLGKFEPLAVNENAIHLNKGEVLIFS